MCGFFSSSFLAGPGDFLLQTETTALSPCVCVRQLQAGRHNTDKVKEAHKNNMEGWMG